MADSAVILAVIAILATTTGALIWIIKYLFSDFRVVMEKLVAVTDANTDATKIADKYLRERNGRDIEFHTEIMNKLIDVPLAAGIQADKVASELKKQNDIIAKELRRVGDLTAEKLKNNKTLEKQSVIQQTVETQIIK